MISKTLLEAIYAAAFVENRVKMRKIYDDLPHDLERADREAAEWAMSTAELAAKDFADAAERRPDLLPSWMTEEPKGGAA